MFSQSAWSTDRWWSLDSYNTMVITSLLSSRRASQFRACDSPPIISPVPVPTQWQQRPRSMGVHCVEMDHSNQCHPGKPLGSAAAAQQRARAALRLVCDTSSFKWEPGVGSICYRRLIFHWWPKRKTEGKDGMMTWLCKAHRRSGQTPESSSSRNGPQPKVRRREESLVSEAAEA